MILGGSVSANTINTPWYSDELRDTVSHSIVQVWDNLVQRFHDWNSSFGAEQDQANDSEDILVFQDIANNPYKDSITLLQKKHLIQWYNHRYFPWNHVRLSMLLKVLINSYRSIAHINPPIMGKECLNFAYNKWLLNNIAQAHQLDDIVYYPDFKQILSNFAYQYPLLVDQEVLSHIPGDNNIVTKDKMAYYLVNFFAMNPQWVKNPVNVENYVFDDTAYHVFGDDVELLVKKWVIKAHTNKFAIDDLATRADLLVLMTNSLLRLRNENLLAYTTLQSTIRDIVGKPYEMNAIYANKDGLLDYLLETKRWQTYFYPQRLLSKYEVYYVLWWISGKYFDYDMETADHEHITRGELAHLIVESFDFDKDTPIQIPKHSKIKNQNDESPKIINLSALEDQWILERIKNFFSSLWTVHI